MALGDAAAALVQKLDQPPPSPEVHPELVEEGTVGKVMLVGDCRHRRREDEEGGLAPAFQTLRRKAKTCAEHTEGDQRERRPEQHHPGPAPT